MDTVVKCTNASSFGTSWCVLLYDVRYCIGTNYDIIYDLFTDENIGFINKMVYFEFLHHINSSNECLVRWKWVLEPFACFIVHSCITIDTHPMTADAVLG